MIKKVLIPVANGVEEIETVTLIDILRRADTEVTVASVDQLNITCSRKIKLTADKLISECVDETFDLIALPGGMPGAENLNSSVILQKILRIHLNKNGLISAICAAPCVILENSGFLTGKNATCHSNFMEKMITSHYINKAVVVDNNFITSQGAGTAIDLALTLVEILINKEKRDEISSSIMLHR